MKIKSVNLRNLIFNVLKESEKIQNSILSDEEKIITIKDIFNKDIDKLNDIEELSEYLDVFQFEKPYPAVLNPEEKKLKKKILKRISQLESRQEPENQGKIKSSKVFQFPVKDDLKDKWSDASSSQMPGSKHSGFDWPGVKEGDVYYAIGDGTIKYASPMTSDGGPWKDNFRWYYADGDGINIQNEYSGNFGSGYGEAKIIDQNQDIPSEDLGEPEPLEDLEDNYITLQPGANIVYQAFPGLSEYDRFENNLVSGPKGLENYWDDETKTYTGTHEQTEALVDNMDNRISNTIKQRWKDAIKVQERGTQAAPGDKDLEPSKGGKGITLELIDPEDGTKFSFYCGHLDQVYVKKNQKVKKGDELGIFGDTGRSTNVHPHFQLHNYSNLFGEETRELVKSIEVWENLFKRMSDQSIFKRGLDLSNDINTVNTNPTSSKKPVKLSDFRQKRSPEEEIEYIKQQIKDLEKFKLKENFKYKKLDEFVDQLDERKKRKKKPNGMRSVKKRADNNPKITRMDFLPDDVLNKIAKEKNLDEFVNKLDERKKRKKKYTAKNIPNNYKSKVSKKARSSMAREMNKCAKTPRPKSCYDYWDADKKHDKAMSESIERFVNIINENNKTGISINDKNTTYYIDNDKEDGNFLIKKETENFIKYNVTFTFALYRNKPLKIKNISKGKDKDGKDKIEITVFVLNSEHTKIITDKVKNEIIANYGKNEFTISGSLGSMTFKKMTNLAKESIELDRFVELLYEKKLSKKTKDTLKKKAEKANMPLVALTSVYRKGLGAWLTGHRPGTPQHAWAMARVNSFIRGGKTRSVDKAEWKKVQKHRKK